MAALWPYSSNGGRLAEVDRCGRPVIRKRLKKERYSTDNDSAQVAESKFRAEGNLTQLGRGDWSSYHQLATVGDFPVPPGCIPPREVS
jgi:hypothetical protein